MKLKFARVGFVLLIWLLTTRATMQAARLAWHGEWEKAKDVLRLQDRAGSAGEGWDPRFTVSAHCGTSAHRDCRMCRFVRWLLGEDHATGAARKEGLLA